MNLRKECDLDFFALADVVASCAPDASHKALMQALQCLPGLENITLPTTRHEDGVSWLTRRAVF